MTKAAVQYRYQQANQQHQLYGPYRQSVLTKSGSLMMGFRMSGYEPDGLDLDDKLALSAAAQVIYQGQGPNAQITQWYINHEVAPPILLTCSDAKQSVLQQARQAYLATQRWTQSHLFHFIEQMPLNEAHSKHARQFSSTFRNLFNQKGASNQDWRALFSEYRQLNNLGEQLEQTYTTLHDTTQQIRDRWSVMLGTEPCKPLDTWRLAKFMANADARYLTDASLNVPPDHWDCCLNDGEVLQITYKHVEMLKIMGERTQFVRVASVMGVDANHTIGLWSEGDISFLSLNINCVICMRWLPMSALQRSLLLKHKSNELERASIDLMGLVMGNASDSVQRGVRNSRLAAGLEQIQALQTLDEPIGRSQLLIMTFADNPDEVLRASRLIASRAGAINCELIWETSYLLEMFNALQVGHQRKHMREIITTASQMGAMSLLYQPTQGHAKAHIIEEETSQYIMTTDNGHPFHFNAYVDGKPLLLGIGPVGSGKSFFKTVIAAHFLKYGGLLSCLDIDGGSESLAQYYAEQGACFKIEPGQSSGFNLFSTCEGADDKAFFRHCQTMIRQMIRCTQEHAATDLPGTVMREIDEAIMAVMHLPAEMRNLDAFLAHSSPELAALLSQWHYAKGSIAHDGVYAGYFDATHDAIGQLERRMSVFNLKAIRHDVEPLALVMSEIFYRMTRVFEDPRQLHLPKSLEIDEAHHFLKNRANRDFFLSCIRTWRKYRAGISLWSQGVTEFSELPDWEVLKASAGTWVFMSNPKLNPLEYQTAFGLSAGQIDCIKRLVPKREALIIQPSLGITRKVKTDVDALHHALATSAPDEVMQRAKLMEQYGSEEGLRKMAQWIEQRQQWSVI